MRSLALVLVILGFHSALPDASADRPPTSGLPADYQWIAKRNPFDLTRSSPHQSVSSGNVSTNPLPDLRLSGITSWPAKRLAYFVENERSNSPQYFVLVVGQSIHEVELLAIDLPAETVKVKRGNTEFELSLKNATPNLSEVAPARGRAGSEGAITTAESLTREVSARPVLPVK